MTNAAAKLDPRIHAFRPDLADIALRPIVTAARYAEPALKQCVKGVVPLLAEPKEGAKRVSEIRYGEFLDVIETRDDGFSWIQNRNDHYVGYIRSSDVLSEEVASLSSRINVLQTFVYAEPDLKSAIQDRLTLGSFVRVIAQSGNFYELPGGGFIFAGHVTPTEEAKVPDYVFTAGRMMGVPYLWGGRTSLGLDCSGLVQLSLEIAGIDAPRDSDQQAELYGQPLYDHWQDTRWARGDLVFFPGHVGIMTSHDHIIHANVYSMQVTVEPLAELVRRGIEITAKGHP